MNFRRKSYIITKIYNFYAKLHNMGTNSFIKKKLLELKNSNNLRELRFSAGVDFSSNDYLGLANHPKIKQTIINSLNSGLTIGSSGSRLLTGNKKEHSELEEFAADYFNSEACLFFSSGFLANYSLFTTLPQRKDFIIYDELIHASIRDGIKASDAKSIKFKHNDLNSLKEKIEKAQSLNANSIWIGIESVYSMDGDIADIKGIIELIKNYTNIYLIIDEAHATGIFGKDGKGFVYDTLHKQQQQEAKSKKQKVKGNKVLGEARALEGCHCEEPETSDEAIQTFCLLPFAFCSNIITLHTCSKALGVSGALVCASKEIIEYLINKSRPFIYTTAESPIIAVAVKESLKLVQEESWRREKLLKLIEYTNKNYLNTKTQIIPIILNDNSQALSAASLLQAKGFDVRAIRPPTVPSARLRISLNVNRTKQEIDELFKMVNRK